MLLTLLIFNILSNAVTLLDNRTFYYSRNISIGIIYSILLCSINIINIDISIFNGLLHIDNLIQVFTIFILLSSLIILNLTNFYPYNNNNNINKIFYIFRIPEYSIIILFINIGAILLISSLDIVTIFLSLELQSYGLYILSTLHRNSESSTSAGLKYFLLGSLASCLILLGLAFIYANIGNTNLENLQIISTISYNSDYYNIVTILNSIEISLIILSIGFLFKIAAAPFHFWSPDVYDQIPTVITSFVAIIAKISILIILYELIKFTFSSWTSSLLLSSLISILIGSILGLTQSRIKRLYAYSAISHIGFILLALSIYSNESIIAFLFYLVQYTLSNINLFFITIIMGYSLYLSNNKPLSNESPLQLISQFKGYSYINPVLALSLSITLFSFAGIPPLSGFFAKQLVLKAALAEGYLFITLIAILTSVISAVYYLVIIKQMFFYKNKDNVVIKELNINDIIINIVSILTLLMLVFIFFINEVLNIFILL